MTSINIKISTCLLLSFLGSCKSHIPEEDAIAFSISDTMMERCEITNATLQDVKNELKLFGKIAADNSKQANIYPIMSGNVLAIHAELGDYVKQGQRLATMKSGEVADFQRQLLDAKADMALAEKNVQVAKELYEGKINSERDVIAAEKELLKAKAELERIEEVYRIYGLREGSLFNITAPISGFIVYKDITQNEQLRSDKADIIFSIAQIDEVWVLANVNESDIPRVKAGYEAEVKTISYPNKIFSGQVDRIFNAIDPSTKAMKILVKIQNPDLLLKPEMSATITLKFSENKKLIAVPSSSIIFDKSKNWVMVFRSRTDIETRQVEIYRQLDDVTYLLNGLKENERVISKSGLMVYDALND
ncbi:MAG: efflux RND transporter periplasmic adaptor subunit [Cyclobacteriaceae bacterium]|nr:efflux RND transporter periplasmic adaptor subunit [Cyclobacteriaceae bacterium]